MKLAQTAAPSFCFALVACVVVPHDPAQGSAHYIASVSPNGADYAQPTAATGAAAAGTPAVSAGPSGSFAPPPPPPPPSTTAGGGVVPTRPMTGSAGTPAAVGGGAGSGVAHAAAGTGTSSGMAGSGATAMAGAGATTGDHAGTLMISFKSVTQNGQYAPLNIGAVWIETSSGTFVKTVERWAGIRATLLTRWNTASGGWGSLFGGGNKADMMDAVSKATLRGYSTHTDMWDMKDTTGKIVPDGKYQVVIEATEDDFRPGASGVVPFEKGAMPVMVNAPDTVPWSGLTLSYQP